MIDVTKLKAGDKLVAKKGKYTDNEGYTVGKEYEVLRVRVDGNFVISNNTNDQGWFPPFIPENFELPEPIYNSYSE